MRVAELWRYPVKSLAGERLESAELTVNGIVGDRVVHVRDERGRVITARTHPRLLALHATLGPDGEPRLDGQPWAAEESAVAVREAAGPDARLARYDGRERFDVLPLLVATDGAIAAAWTGAGSGPTSSSRASRAGPSAGGPAAGSGSPTRSSPSRRSAAGA